MESHVKNFVPNIFTVQVVSNENQNLTLTSENMAEVLGNEGIYLDGKMLTFSSRNDVTIASTNVKHYCLFVHLYISTFLALLSSLYFFYCFAYLVGRIFVLPIASVNAYVVPLVAT